MQDFGMVAQYHGDHVETTSLLNAVKPIPKQLDSSRYCMMLLTFVQLCPNKPLVGGQMCLLDI